MAIQAGVLIALLGGIIFVDLRARRLRRADRKAEALSDGLMVAAFATALGGGLLLAAMPGGGLRLPPVIAAVLGAATGITGLWVRHSAIRQLSGSYTLQLEVRTSQSLVSSGIYAWIRHPGYTGLILQFLAIQITLGFWPSVLALIPLACLFPLRIREEETLLVSHFGSEYTAYAARVPALVPAARMILARRVDT